MDKIWIFIVLAIIVEALTEYGKNLMSTEKKKVLIVQLCALGISVMLCLLAGADIFSTVGIDFSIPYIGSVLTGIFASRGANYANDLIGKLQVKKESEAN